MSKEPTNQEVIDQIKVFVKDHVDERFEDLAGMFNKYATDTEKRFNKIDERFDRVDVSLVRIDERLGKVENRLTKVEGGVRELYTLVDGAMTKAKKVEEEQVSHLAWFRRYDAHLEKVDVDVKKLKLKAKAS